MRTTTTPSMLSLTVTACLHMVQAGVDYAFWSAFAASEAQSKLRSEASALGVDAAALKAVMAAQEQAKQEQQQQQRKEGQSPWMVEPEVVDPRTCILDEDELLEFFEERARAAIEVSSHGTFNGWQELHVAD